MVNVIKKNGVSLYPNPKINCTVNIFAKEEDKVDEQKAVYWIPFNIDLQGCAGMTKEQIDEKVQSKGKELFEAPGMQEIYKAIELGLSLGI